MYDNVQPYRTYTLSRKRMSSNLLCVKPKSSVIVPKHRFILRNQSLVSLCFVLRINSYSPCAFHNRLSSYNVQPFDRKSISEVICNNIAE